MQSLPLLVQCLAEPVAALSLIVQLAIVGVITIYLFLLLVRGHVLPTVLDFTIKTLVLQPANLVIQIAMNAIKRMGSNAYRVRLLDICMS